MSGRFLWQWARRLYGVNASEQEKERRAPVASPLIEDLALRVDWEAVRPDWLSGSLDWKGWR